MRFRDLIVLGLLLLTSCGKKPANKPATEQASTPKIATLLAQAETPTETVVRVQTAEEFIEAIGNDRTIELTANEYVLSDMKDRYMDFVRWDPTTAGNTVTIYNVKRLKIQAAGKKPVRLIVRPYSVFVLNFDNVDDVTLTNLVMGHAPEKGGCESGVVGITQSTNITFKHCDLFGCGTEGLTIHKSRDIHFIDSIIRECSDGIATIEDSKNLTFEHSRFINNEAYYGIYLHHVRDVIFNDCLFSKNNTGDKPTLEAISSSNVVLDGSRFEDNKSREITNKSDAFVVKQTGADARR